MQVEDAVLTSLTPDQWQIVFDHFLIKPVLEKQNQLIEEGANVLKVELKAKLRLCFERKCDICGLKGHENRHCWVNAQMW